MLVKYKLTERYLSRVIPNAVLLPLQLVFMLENVGIKKTVKLVLSCLIYNIFLISDLPDY